MVLLVGEVKTVQTFYKAIVIKIGLFDSVIVDERHFTTMEQAQVFKERITSGSDDLMCIIYQMCQ